uniref:ERCC4 domain-containing protein n=1 Tax=Trichobilharzia regenti TaxID=157069 RepID=A0AA85IV06_TRIRE|nr:unnamed protein product [Trichobilharzia regenti]
MVEAEGALTDLPIIPSKKSKQVKKPRCHQTNAAEKLLKKLENPKNAYRLITCEFDENVLQMSGLLASLTSKLETNWQSSTINHLNSSNDPLEQYIAQQLPPIIQPKSVGLDGPSGSVPVSFAFTWTRYQPRLETFAGEKDEESNDQSAVNIKLDPIVEPEVVILLTTDQIRNLLVKPTHPACKKQKIHKNTNMEAFGTALVNLKRPITCILLTGSNSKAKNPSSSSSSTSDSSLVSSINELCIELQLNWNVHSTRITANLHDVAMILNAFTRSLAERQFKQGRLGRDEGLAFLPDTVRKGLSSCALHGRGPGKAPLPNDDVQSLMGGEHALHSWANRVWLSQLGQWRGLTGEIAYAITLVYPTARSFYNACKSAEIKAATGQGSNRSENQKFSHPFEAELANLEIRRGTGVLASRRRLGPELARRLIQLFTSTNPHEVIN